MSRGGAGGAAGFLALVAVAAMAAGCGGDRDLWERYRAERMLWHARRLEADARAASGGRDRSAEVRAAQAFDAVTAAFPPERWTDDAAWSRPLARDVALLSASAALLHAALDEDAGRDADAEARYAEVAGSFARVDSARILALAGRARCLERQDRDGEALGAWLELSAREVTEAPRGAARRWLLEAPGQAARLLEEAGRPVSADSLRDAVTARLETGARRLGLDSAATDLWVANAGLREQARDPRGARQALRRALATAGSESSRGAILLALVRRAADEGNPDTVQAYSRWLSREIGGAGAREGELVLGRSWEAAGVADSALAVYKRLVERPSVGSDVSARARYARALLLERLGRWEIARAELRTLALLFPSHECGLGALVQIVRHSRQDGETELAGVEAHHALLQLDDQLATQGDPDVRIRIRRAKAELLGLSGDPAGALRELSSIWEQDPGRPGAAAAGWFAARLADSALGERQRAQELYTQLAVQAGDLEVRHRARARLKRGG